MTFAAHSPQSISFPRKPLTPIAAGIQNIGRSHAPVSVSLRQATADDFSALPAQMLAARRWVVWKSVPQSDKKPRKIPYYVSGEERGKGIQLDSSEDQAQFATFDDALLAMRTGRYTGLGFALGPDGTGSCWQGIDLDDMPTRPALTALAPELPGYTETSPSGNGMHAIGYGRPFATLGNNASGIEAYAGGRYLTVTGKGAGIHPLACLADFVEQRLKPLHGRQVESFDVHEIEQVPTLTITHLRSALLFMRANDRGLWVCMGLALKTLGDVGRGLFLEWSATSEKFDPGEDAKTWESFKPTRTNYKTVFAEAQRQGWTNPASSAALGVNTGDSSGCQVNNKGEPFHEPLEAANSDADPVATLEQNIITLDGLEDAFAPLPHCVDKWIPHGEVTLLAGHGGSGKTYVALSIAMHVALGLPFGLLSTSQTNVLFFSAEDGKQVLRQRLARLCRALKLDPLQLDGKLHLLDASDIDPALHREQRENIKGRQQIVTRTLLLDALAKLVKKLNVGLVVIDNASDTYDDDEIKRSRVRAFVRSLRSGIARPDRAVLLLAHINKSSAMLGPRASKEDYSGSTAWHNSVRSRLSLTPAGTDALTVEHVKANLGEKADPVLLEWNENVPLVAGSYTNAKAALAANLIKAAESERDNTDKDALVALIQDFDKRGEHINTSTQGPYSTYRQIKGHPGFPKNVSLDRLTNLLRELETKGTIYRRTVRTGNRKYKEVFTCVPVAVSTPAPEDEAKLESPPTPEAAHESESAPIPDISPIVKRRPRK